ncbi:programmed cell death protein 7-like isoform X2 [Dysidea avara]|uniref:programmed cell death protein 7-like isoform X2 n=1 Tax=Dysidea avara TaxID=196820 RepID=UPI003326D7EF
MFSYKLFLLPPSLILSLGAHKSTIINKPVDFFFCVLTPVNECDDGFCCVFVKIPEARHLLRRAVELISMLKKCSDTRGNDLSQVVCLQTELDSIQRSIEPSLEDLVKKMRGRTKKRVRISSRRQQWQSEHDNRCRDAHKKADEWLANKEAQKLKLKMEKEVKLSAANTLLEVETKQSDVLRYIKFVELLEQLKSHRQTMHHKSTDQSVLQADEKFQNTIQSLLEFLSSRKLEYEKERKALHVIMEEEVQDRIAAATASKPDQVLLQQPSLISQHPSTTHEVYALLHIRKQWDAFMSPIGTPLPKDPLLPSTPSSSDWEAYLVSR